MSATREHVRHYPNGYPVAMKHSDGRVTLIPGDSSMRGRDIDCNCCTDNDNDKDTI